MIDAATAVSWGASLLDEKIPDWYTKIDVGILDLANVTACIVGQLAGNKHLPGEFDGSVQDRLAFHRAYSDKLVELGIGSNATAYGFDVPRSYFTSQDDLIPKFQQLTRLWLHEIAFRLRADNKDNIAALQGIVDSPDYIELPKLDRELVNA